MVFNCEFSFVASCRITVRIAISFEESDGIFVLVSFLGFKLRACLNNGCWPLVANFPTYSSGSYFHSL